MSLGMNRLRKNSILRLGLGGAALQSVRENSVVPPGLESVLPRFPALKRWAKFGRPSGAAFSFAIAVVLAATGCGYHTAGNKVDLPQNIRTIAIPGFVSQSQTFRIEQLLTDAVVREFNARTQYRVIHQAKGDADAVLKATVLSASATPLAYDSQTGRAASALVTVSIQVTLTDRQGKVLFDNPSYLFHDQYEISHDLRSFFEEDSPAVDRLSRDFARTLVANILEAY
jgi:outer membrane lipopolysaccharide assembly protein LptE/RlpB